MVVTMYDFKWRVDVANEELNALHAEAFNHSTLEIDWMKQIKTHSLGWVTARHREDLIGFVNVAWDGGIHAFILDTIGRRGQGDGG
jgi:hypothetical protein